MMLIMSRVIQSIPSPHPSRIFLSPTTNLITVLALTTTCGDDNDDWFIIKSYQSSLADWHRNLNINDRDQLII